MNAFVRAAKDVFVPLDEIDIPESARPYNATEVVALKGSIATLGLQVPLSVIEREDRFVLIAGRHRLEALRLLNAEKAPCRVVDMSDVEARMWTLSENLHRAELTVSQRADQIAEWIRLTEARQVAQLAPAVLSDGRSAGPQHAPSGVRAAARELGVDRDEARRAVKMASITPQAKDAARQAGLDDNQSALLKVASYADEDQVEAVERIAQSRAQPPGRAIGEVASSPTAKPLRNLVGISGGELARWVRLTTPHDRMHVVHVLEMAAAILRAEAATQ
jgi:ParB-like chromosome segregation protein Spo0J